MVSDLKTFAQKGCKIAAPKKVSFSANFSLLAGFFVIGATIRICQDAEINVCKSGEHYEYFHKSKNTRREIDMLVNKLIL